MTWAIDAKEGGVLPGDTDKLTKRSIQWWNWYAKSRCGTITSEVMNGCTETTPVRVGIARLRALFKRAMMTPKDLDGRFEEYQTNLT